MSKLLRRFAQNESGATAIEYGLIASLIAIALITGASVLGARLNAVFSGIKSKLVVPT